MRKSRTEKLSTFLTSCPQVSKWRCQIWRNTVKLYSIMWSHGGGGTTYLYSRMSLLFGCKECSWLTVSNHMSKFLNQDYIISPANDGHSMAEILRSGISVQYESFLMGNFAPKSLCPDENLTDLYPSLRLFFSQNSDLDCSLEAFPGPLPTKFLTYLTPIQELLPRETTYTWSLLITLWWWPLKNII